jgi:hypothetical protein
VFLSLISSIFHIGPRLMFSCFHPDLSLEACAIIDMHYLRSPEAVLYQLTVHLSALQRRVADLCLQHPELARKLQTSALKSASATSSAVTVLNDTLSLDATRALGFRSLTIVVGRGRNAATQVCSDIVCR